MIEMRLAKKEDLKRLADIYRRAFNAASPTKQWSAESAAALMAYWFERKPDLFFVAEENGALLGAAVSNIKPWRDGNRLHEPLLFIDPAHQKKEIGKRLFAKLIEEAVTKYNANTLEAITFAGDEFPLTWYKALGIYVDEGAVLIKGDCREILNKLDQ